MCSITVLLYNCKPAIGQLLPVIVSLALGLIAYHCDLLIFCILLAIVPVKVIKSLTKHPTFLDNY